MPSWAEVEAFLDAHVDLVPWQKAMVASMLSGPPGYPVSFQTATNSRGWGKALVDRWAMCAAHWLDVHVHFLAPEANICVGKQPACPDTVPYDFEEMKP